METNRWLLEVRWRWGRSCSFTETDRYTVGSKAEVDECVLQTIKRAVANFAFDCGRPYSPLNPVLTGYTLTPVGDSEWYSTHPWDEDLKDAVEAKRLELIGRGRDQ